MKRNKEIKRVFKDKRSGTLWKYITKESMEEMYPESGYKVIGEVLYGNIATVGKTIILDEYDKKTIPIQDNGKYSKKYFTVGYIPTVNEDEYIVVKRKKKNIVPWICLMLALLLGIGGWFILQREEGPDIDPAIKDYVSNLKRPDNLDETRTAIPGFGSWTIEADTSQVQVELFNPEGNPCYFKYTVSLEDTGEVLYESKLIPPGKGIQNINLNKKMKQGTYNLSIKIDTYDLNDYKVSLNGANVKVALKAI